MRANLDDDLVVRICSKTEPSAPGARGRDAKIGRTIFEAEEQHWDAENESSHADGPGCRQLAHVGRFRRVHSEGSGCSCRLDRLVDADETSERSRLVEDGAHEPVCGGGGCSQLVLLGAREVLLRLTSVVLRDGVQDAHEHVKGCPATIAGVAKVDSRNRSAVWCAVVLPVHSCVVSIESQVQRKAVAHFW